MKNSNRLIGIFILFAAICVTIVIISEDLAYTPPEVSTLSATDSIGEINLNTATAEELQTLDGVGSALAGRIIEFRTTVRQFETVYDLKLVSGIGGQLFDSIKNSVTID